MYKLKLPDGSIRGPLSADQVLQMYRDGLVFADSPALGPGAREWKALGLILDLGGHADGARPGSREAGMFVLALVAVAVGAPWIGQASPQALTAYAQLAALPLILGVAVAVSLLRGSLRSPLLVLVLAAVALLAVGAGFALLPLPKLALLGLLGLILLAAAGTLGLVSGEEPPSGMRLYGPLLGLFLSFVGASVGATPFFRALNSGIERERLFSSFDPARKFADLALGFEVPAAEGWELLKPDNPLLTVADPLRAAFYHPGSSCLAAIRIERSPAEPSLEDFLTAELTGPLRGLGAQEVARGEATLGGQPARGAIVRFGGADGDRGRLVVAHDGPTYFSVLGWAPATSAGRAEAALDALVKGVSISATYQKRLDANLEHAAGVPLLGPEQARAFLRAQPLRDWSSGQILRAVYEKAVRGVPALEPAEAGELRRLNTALVGAMTGDGRQRFAAFLEDVRGKRTGSAEEDEAMAGLLAKAFSRLSARDQAAFQRVLARAYEIGSR
jgi:hypothetical protein